MSTDIKDLIKQILVLEDVAEIKRLALDVLETVIINECRGDVSIVVASGLTYFISKRAANMCHGILSDDTKSGGLIPAIKYLRGEADLGLKEAKDICDAIKLKGLPGVNN